MHVFSQIGLNIWIFVAIVFVFSLWVVVHVKTFGSRGILIGIFRLMWIIPIILCLFPKDKIIRVKTDFVKDSISVLVDDSFSMVKSGYDYKAKLKKLEEICDIKGCSINVDYLSSLHPYTTLGYSPLQEVVGSWIQGRYGPWILISDGGDSLSKIDWNIDYKPESNQQKGYILGYLKENNNKWISQIQGSSVFFEDSPINIFLKIKRNNVQKEVIQIQVILEDKVLLSQNVDFLNQKTELDINMSIPPLKRGNYNLKIKVLPSEHEAVLWDNEAYLNVNVSTNTLGVLHIQGSPNWDGRFVRRYLKSDPKFDLISFFILRDLLDNLDASERESSLIPFPVDRLFVNEINHFKVIVLQNFSLYKFLQSPQYQENIVNFVTQGGGLLYIGGRNALRDMDIFHKDFSSIIPFEVKYKKSKSSIDQGTIFFDDSEDINTQGPYYSKDTKFYMESEMLSSSSKNLYDVYNDWSKYDDILKNTEFQGIHRMDNVLFKKDSQILVSARIKNQGTASFSSDKKIPVIVGSHPGKGRALWIFTDSLWKLAFSSQSRNVYNDIMNSSLRWLMYQDEKPYLSINSFQLNRKIGSKKITWKLDLEGAASKFIDIKSGWKIDVCNRVVDDISIDNSGFSNTIIEGQIDDDGVKKYCRINIRGEGSAFGYVSASSSSYIGDIFLDNQDEIKDGSRYILDQLSLVTNSMMSINDIPVEKSVSLEEWLEQGRQVMNFDTKHESDSYWFFRSWYFYIMVIGIFMEVVFRKKII